MIEEPSIDELLNGFIDEELTARHQTEVQRLIAHDPQIAKRLRQLQKCKMLLSYLPKAKAPDEMLEKVKASLERTTLPSEQSDRFDRREGARHLLIRRVIAAAAMVGLLAVLSAVIYNIVSPEAIREKPVISKDWQQSAVKSRVAGKEQIAIATTVAESGFNGTLELKINNLAATDAFINRAIEDNGLSDYAGISRQIGRNEYSLTSSRQAANLMLSDLVNIWAKLDSARLLVQGGDIDKPIVVNSVTAEQVAEIISKETPEKCIKTAKDFAVLNRMAEILPGKELLAATSNKRLDSITIPKPVLTSNTNVNKSQASKFKAGQEVNLTIVVLAGK